MNAFFEKVMESFEKSKLGKDVCGRFCLKFCRFLVLFYLGASDRG